MSLCPWVTQTLSLLTLLVSASAHSPAHASAWHDLQEPLAPGDTFLLCGTNSYPDSGIYRVDPNTGACSFFKQVNSGASASFDYDSHSNRLAVWGVVPPDHSPGIYFIDKNGDHTRVDLAPGVTAMACDGQGRTYVNLSGYLHYFSGTEGSPVIVPVIDALGNGATHFIPYSVGILDMLYDPKLNALLIASTEPGGDGVYDAVLRMLFLSSSGNEVTTVGLHVWPGTPMVHELYLGGLSRGADGELYASVEVQGLTDISVFKVEIDPATHAVTDEFIACFSRSYHTVGAFTWGWQQAAPLLIGGYKPGGLWLPAMFIPTIGCSGALTLNLTCIAPNILGSVAAQTIPPLKRLRRR